MREPVGGHRVSLRSIYPSNRGAPEFLVDPQDVFEPVRHRSKVTDDANDSSASGPSLQFLERLVEGVRIKSPEALVKEQ